MQLSKSCALGVFLWRLNAARTTLCAATTILSSSYTKVTSGESNGSCLHLKEAPVIRGLGGWSITLWASELIWENGWLLTKGVWNTALGVLLWGLGAAGKLHIIGSPNSPHIVLLLWPKIDGVVLVWKCIYSTRKWGQCKHSDSNSILKFYIGIAA